MNAAKHIDDEFNVPDAAAVVAKHNDGRKKMATILSDKHNSCLVERRRKAYRQARAAAGSSDEERAGTSHHPHDSPRPYVANRRTRATNQPSSSFRDCTGEAAGSEPGVAKLMRAMWSAVATMMLEAARDLYSDLSEVTHCSLPVELHMYMYTYLVYMYMYICIYR